MRRLASALFAAIALLAIAALGLTQELRSQPDVVNSVKVKATDDGRAGRIRFRLTEHEPRATISVIARSGTVVAEPVSAQPLGPGSVRLRWNGLDEARGAPADPGRYRVRFELATLDREARLGTIRIEENE